MNLQKINTRYLSPGDRFRYPEGFGLWYDVISVSEDEIIFHLNCAPPQTAKHFRVWVSATKPKMGGEPTVTKAVTLRVSETSEVWPLPYNIDIPAVGSFFRFREFGDEGVKYLVLAILHDVIIFDGARHSQLIEILGQRDWALEASKRSNRRAPPKAAHHFVDEAGVMAEGMFRALLKRSQE